MGPLDNKYINIDYLDAATNDALNLLAYAIDNCKKFINEEKCDIKIKIKKENTLLDDDMPV